ncbi:MAG: hypothetical protein KDE51_20020, partial [Anaerolineales bacterium]|nr:hypothetical protein [Anaerolineales bacterium]
TTRREQLVQLTAPVTILEAPLVASDAPNIFVSINIYEPETEGVGPNTWNSLPDAYLRTATTEIKIPVTDKTLVVTITPDQDEYAPREQATFTVRVTNQQGDPVSAEVSLAMVDEALYALSEDLSEPMFESFYYDRNNIVTTYNSLRPSRELWGGGMGGGGGDGGYEGAPRSDFPDTAAWFPRLLTDANGEAQVTLTIPDNLTTWRLTGKATTADTQVGESITNFIVSKEIIVRPLLPRTLTAGDEILLSAMVQNYSDLTLTFDVTITAVDDVSGEEALLFNDEATQKVTLEPGESRIVGWSASAPQASNARITVAAVFQNQLLDGVELPLVIKPLAVPDVTTFIGQFQGTKSLEIDMPAEALPMSTVKIELSRSIAGTLFEGLEYLTGFPYGCVEQTMSKALPNAVVGRAFNQLGLANPTLDADLPAKIDAGIQKLYGYQHNDGGWGWWFDDASDHYQTAWVIFGLVNTAEAGYEIDPQVIQRGANWLQNELPSMNPKTRAYALYSMALAVDFLDQPSAAADPEALSADYVLTRVRDLVDEHYDNLDPFSQASLTLALWELGAAAEARELLEQLEETAVRDSVNGQVYWGLGDSDGYYHQKTMASRTRTTAHMLSAFSRIQPNHELVGGMVRYLMAQRGQNGWGTTNETSFAIIGLTDHLLATSFNDEATETTYRVVLNGEEITSGNLGRGEPAVALELSAELFRSGSNQLRIEQGGTGQLYYGVKQTVFVAQEEIAAAGAIKIERQYFDGQNRPLDLESVAPGDLVRVQLKVTVPGDLSYVIVEDKIPGGLEALNERLNTTTHTGVGYEPHYYWQSYGYNHKEVFADRVSFFITELSRGTHTYEYMTRVTHAGTFVAMPAEAYAMYDLTSWGRSASQAITITAE